MALVENFLSESKTRDKSSFKGDEDKRAHIMCNAFQVFMRYGFQRTTMDAIAQECGMSRPALYQVFKNKSDIFRAVILSMRERAFVETAQLLIEPTSPRERIEHAIKTTFLDLLASVEATPHGTELVELGNGLCVDILGEWKTKNCKQFEAVYREAIGNSGFDPAILSWQLADWIDGMKVRIKDPSDRYGALKAFLDVQFAAMRSEKP